MMKCLNCKRPEFPIVRKCCFCVPIRRGIIIFGYVNLVLSLLSIPLLIFLLVAEVSTGQSIEKQGHLEPVVHLSMTIGFVIIDIIMNIVLLVGAHKKKRILLKVYFYFGLIFQLLTLCVDLTYLDYREYVENTVYFTFLGINIYLLFLVFNAMYVMAESADVQYVVYRCQQPL